MADWDDDDWDADDAKPAPQKGNDFDDDEWETQDQPSAASTAQAPSGPERKVRHVDSMADLELNLQSQVDTLVKMLVQKVESCSAKKGAFKFLDGALKDVQGRLTLTELQQFQKHLQDAVNKKKAVLQEQEKQKKIEEAKAEEERMKKELGEHEVADEDYFKDFM